MKQTCRITGKEFEITPMHLEALRSIGEGHPHIGEALPAPTIHPFEQLRRFYALGSLSTLYSCKSNISGEPTITRIPGHRGYKVCTPEEYQSDAVNNLQHGRSYDFSKPFFDQLNELIKDCILPPINNVGNENSSYTNAMMYSQNMYMSFVCVSSSDSLYSYWIQESRECVDCLSCKDCELCISSTDCFNSYRLRHCQFCKSSSDLFGCLDMHNSTHCYGCTNMENASYCIFNKQYTQEEYMKILERKSLHTFIGQEAALKECSTFIATQGTRPSTIEQCEDSTGTYLYNSKMLEECYQINTSENCGYLMSTGVNSNNCWLGFSVNSSQSYLSGVVNSHGTVYTYSSFGGQNNLYSYMLSQGTSNCFGCVSLKKNEYCILNKQYSKEEYEELVPRIINHMKSTGEWGELLPPEYSPYPFKESAGNDIWFEGYDNMPDKELIRRGYLIDNASKEKKVPQHTLPIPESMLDLNPEDVLGKVYYCIETGLPITYQAKELAIYKKMLVPLPKVHWRRRLKVLGGDRMQIPRVA